MGKTKVELLKEACGWCIDNDKSTEFMIQYMMDYAGATHSEVMNFLRNEWKEE